MGRPCASRSRRRWAGRLPPRWSRDRPVRSGRRTTRGRGGGTVHPGWRRPRVAAPRSMAAAGARRRRSLGANLSYPGPTFLGLLSSRRRSLGDLRRRRRGRAVGQFAVLEAGQDRTVWVGSDLGSPDTPAEAGPRWRDLGSSRPCGRWQVSPGARERRRPGSPVSRMGLDDDGPESGFPDEAILGSPGDRCRGVLGDRGGLYRFTDGRWTLAWPDTGAGPTTAGLFRSSPSEDEAWVSDGQGLGTPSTAHGSARRPGAVHRDWRCEATGRFVAAIVASWSGEMAGGPRHGPATPTFGRAMPSGSGVDRGFRRARRASRDRRRMVIPVHFHCRGAGWS
jgi:hypothetical protein